LKRFVTALATFAVAACLLTGCTTATGAHSYPPSGAASAPTSPVPAVQPVSTPTDVAKKPPAAAPTRKRKRGKISWKDASDHIGERTTVEGLVVNTNFASSSNGGPTFLDVGKEYPDPDRFSVVIWEESRGSFPEAPEDMYLGKRIVVKGLIKTYRGVPEIIVDSPKDILAAY
jgi:hypothetical protein